MIGTQVGQEQGLELHRLTRSDFEALGAAGILEDGSRVELLDGLILNQPMESPAHANTCERVEEALRAAFGSGYRVRAGKPIALDDFTEPEPDVSVVEGSVRTLPDQHPGTAVLLVEVSGTTLRKDQGAKLCAYARNGIPEYWIVNLVDHHVEVYRSPVGESYSDRAVLRTSQTIAPLALPDALISISNFFS